MKRFNKAALLVGLFGLSGSAAQAAEFTLMIYETPGDLAKRNDEAQAAAYWAPYNAFAGELAAAGVLRGGSALSETESATVRGSPGTKVTTKQPRLGGYFVIDVADLAAAKQWASKAPPAAVAIEVRPHRANPTMAAK